jgi:hypothetical protein
MRDLLETLQVLDIIDRFDIGGKSPVHAKHLVLDDTSDRKVIEHVREVLPSQRIAELLLAFHVETVVLRNAAGLVVTTYQRHAIRVPDFEEGK